MWGRRRRGGLDLLLLTEQDVRQVPEYAGAVKDQSPRSAPPNPDLRGPCGAAIGPMPGRADAALARFSGATYEVAAIVGYAAPDELAGFVGALRADLRPLCPPFDKILGEGLHQWTGQTAAVDVAGVGDEAVAWTQVVAVLGARRRMVSIVVRVERTIAYVVIGDERLAAPANGSVRLLAELAAVRLRG